MARELIGKRLVTQTGDQLTAGWIVETEAYLPVGDSACHASKYRTPRTEVMFGPAGFAYVYPIHGRYCFNVVTEQLGKGCAVLIRSVEPISGIPVMQGRRGVDDLRRLSTGPSCLCQAMKIDRTVNQNDLTTGISVRIEEGLGLKNATITIKSSVRIGVTSAKTRRLRYYAAGNQFVSGPLSLRT